MRTPPGRRPRRPRPRTSRPVAAKNASSSVAAAVAALQLRRPARARAAGRGRGSRPARRAPRPRRGRGCRAGSSRRGAARISRMNSCTSRFERGSSPVVGSSSSSSTGEVRSARASATFCCMPRERFSIGSPRRSAGNPTRPRISGISPRVSRRRHPVEARRVVEVLGRRHLLEERRLDRDAVDEPLHGPLRRVTTSWPKMRARAAVGEQQRREQADQRRLARPVLAEDGDALAALHREGDPVQRRDGPLREPARLPVATEERLAQVLDDDGRRAPVMHGRRRLELDFDHRDAPSENALHQDTEKEARPGGPRQRMS